MSIDRIETIVEDKCYIDYRVTYKDSSKGGADLRIMEYESGHHMRLEFQSKNIPVGSLAAEIFFYPHSSTSPRRQGVGSQVLDHILSDAKSRGVSVVYIESTNNIANKFFLKKKFTNGPGNHCYCILVPISYTA